MLKISKANVIGHTFIVASHSDNRLCKILSYTIGVGYGMVYSINGENDTMVGFTKNIDEIVEFYNSVV